MSTSHAKMNREIPVAENIQVLGLTNYQEGAVVSRTLIHRNTATVTLFAFDEGQGLTEHTTPFDALAQILEGDAEISISGKPLTLTAGDIVLMPAHEPHAVKALAKFKMLLTMIRSS
jgi:quercetin dioxygenase-like cupin family protein